MNKKVSALSLLYPVSSVTVQKTSSFVALSNFVIKNNSENAEHPGVKISYIGEKFRLLFLCGEGKTEGSASKMIYSVLCCKELQDDLFDGDIITEIGDETKVAVTLARVFSLMEKQSNGEGGNLLVTGRTNIFYVLDQKGTLCVVRVNWFIGWNIEAYSIRDPRPWRMGTRVFYEVP